MRCFLKFGRSAFANIGVWSAIVTFGDLVKSLIGEGGLRLGVVVRQSSSETDLAVQYFAARTDQTQTLVM
jgi:hypothetical protein